MSRISLGAVRHSGRTLFAIAIIGLGIETVLCAGRPDYSYSQAAVYQVVPVVPWLPSSLVGLTYAFGAMLTACGIALFARSTLRTAAMTAGAMMFAGAMILDVPRYAARLGDMSVRTEVFEPLSLAALAWLLAGRDAIPAFLERASRCLLAVSLAVFGVDHFLALAPIGNLVPSWIPWHVFWIAFFGAGFIAAGVSIGLYLLPQWGAAAIGLMFAIWVFTLHLPLVVNDPHNPDAWSSLYIAIALWGGPWALAGNWRGGTGMARAESPADRLPMGANFSARGGD